MIREVIEHYGGTVPATSGGNRSMRCPFHGDSHSSASINLDEDLFNCFTCGIGGDGIAIIKWREDCDYPTAFRIAEEVSGGSDSNLRRGSVSKSASDYGLPGRSRDKRRPGKKVPAWRS